MNIKCYRWRRLILALFVLSAMAWWLLAGKFSRELHISPRMAAPARVMLALRTSRQFHTSRMQLLARTWLQNIPPIMQVWVFSDDSSVRSVLGNLSGVVVPVSGQCGVGHVPRVLCCRLGEEISAFLDTSFRWFCHFDDDSYVNIACLMRLLHSMNPIHGHFLGRRSHSAIYRTNGQSQVVEFATGGAGFCVSRAALLKSTRSLVGGQLERRCVRWRTPDDVTLAMILDGASVAARSNTSLVHEHRFHSHLEQLDLINSSLLSSQISLSYSLRNGHSNIVSLAGAYSRLHDPTRFISLHALLRNKSDCS